MKKRSLKSNAVLQGLLDYLSQTGKEDLLPEVTKSLENVVAKSKKAEEIIVNSALPLKTEEIKNLKNVLKKITNVDLPVVNKVDKKLIGGFTVRLNDWFLDASLYHQLQLIKQSLLW
ncbi:ATP synthase F1 subunit delta [Candidatus Gottesmanbacteria bacterium]|nr:ATP synthase F1 subunit delta [Candidatus Gottesmanbacteria bacterium]